MEGRILKDEGEIRPEVNGTSLRHFRELKSRKGGGQRGSDWLDSQVLTYKHFAPRTGQRPKFFGVVVT